MVKQLSRALRSKGSVKEIRHVWAAIRFHEHRRKEVAKIKEERKEGKEYVLARQRQETARRKNIKLALRNAKEDWALGPLRPNRATGSGKEMYGTVDREQLSIPEIPERFRGNKLLQKRNKTIPASALQEAMTIAIDDRVVIMKGKDKGQIGVVKEVDPNTNSVTVKDLNKIWVDGTMYDANNPSKQELELPVSVDDVRLVVPQTINGVRQDVIVESICLEEHTRGKNLFTGEYESGIPEDQRIDPETGERIWHRYIAGTRTRIEWPWEETAQKRRDARENAKAKGKPLDGEAALDKSSESEHKDSLTVLDRMRQVVSKVTGSKSTKPKADETETEQSAPDSLGEEGEEEQPLVRPREREPVQYDGDTTRNYIEDEQYRTWIPSLKYEPFPAGVLEEVAGPEYMRKKILDRDADDFQERIAAIRARKAEALEQERQAKQKHIDTMKTPLQVKWELEQAEKAAQPPRELPTSILAAIGQHMAAQRALQQSKQPKLAHRQ